MHIDTTFPPPGECLGAILAVAAHLDCAELGAAIDALIERMDAAAGDPDLEDDDPAGGDIVDVPHDAEADFGAEELGEEDVLDNLDEEVSPRAAMIEHRDRIRRTRCSKRRYAPLPNATQWRPYTEWVLPARARVPGFGA